MRKLKSLLVLIVAMLLLPALAFADAKVQPYNPPPPPLLPYVLEGVISGINPGNGQITLRFPATPRRTPEGFFVNSFTKVLKNNQPSNLNALEIGDFCRAEIKPTSQNVPLAVSLRVRSQTQPQPKPVITGVRGNITAIEPTGQGFSLKLITENGNGLVMRFYADKETKIKKNGQAVGFGDLKLGDFAEVGYVAPAPKSTERIRANGISARTVSN